MRNVNKRKAFKIEIYWDTDNQNVFSSIGGYNWDTVELLGFKFAQQHQLYESYNNFPIV